VQSGFDARMIVPWAFRLKCPFGMISMHPTDDRISRRSWLLIRPRKEIRYVPGEISLRGFKSLL
jgi:hypothetical protein